MTSGSFSDLDLAHEGDQIYLFQGPNDNPLDAPDAHIFVLDDTGAFEPATDSQSGAVPPGLVEKRALQRRDALVDRVDLDTQLSDHQPVLLDFDAR